MSIFCDTKRIMVAHKDGTGPLQLISHSIDLNLSRKRAKLPNLGIFRHMVQIHFLTILRSF